MARYAVLIFALCCSLRGAAYSEGPADVELARQYAEIRNKVLGDLDNPHNGVMPLDCQDVKIKNPEGMRHFIRGCNLVGVYAPHDNMTSAGLSSEEMLAGLNRAIGEFQEALKASPKLRAAQKKIDYCEQMKDSEYLKSRPSLK